MSALYWSQWTHEELMSMQGLDEEDIKAFDLDVEDDEEEETCCSSFCMECVGSW
jgi:hypothetical protein